MGLSLPAANDLLLATFHNSAFNVTSVYLAFYSDTPDMVSSGTELAYSNNYARIGGATWSVPTSGNVSNLTVVVASATGDWDPIGGIGIFTVGSQGERIFQETLTNTITVSSGDSVTFAVGDLIFSVVSC